MIGSEPAVNGALDIVMPSNQLDFIERGEVRWVHGRQLVDTITRHELCDQLEPCVRARSFVNGS